MFDTAKSTSESSLLLWMLAAAVAMFAAYVSLGWVREAQREPGWRTSWKGLLLASGCMGAGISSCMVLALSAAALPFPLGYPVSHALGLWPLAMLACVPACAWLIRSQGVVATLGSGLLLAIAALGTQAAWLDAVGFRPGIIWRLEFMAAAGVLLVLGLVAGVWVSYSVAARTGRRRRLWRIGGATLVGLTLVAGQEVFMAGAGLLAQVGSVYKDHVPAALLCLVAGVVVPLAMAVMAVDLEMRRRQRRRHRSKGGSSAAPGGAQGALSSHAERLDPSRSQPSRSGLLSSQEAAQQALADMSKARTAVGRASAEAGSAAGSGRGKRRRRSGGGGGGGASSGEASSGSGQRPGRSESADAETEADAGDVGAPRSRGRSRRSATAAAASQADAGPGAGAVLGGADAPSGAEAGAAVATVSSASVPVAHPTPVPAAGTHSTPSPSPDPEPAGR